LEYYLIIVTWKDTLVGAEADLAREQGMKCAHGFNETGTDFMNEVRYSIQTAHKEYFKIASFPAQF